MGQGRLALELGVGLHRHGQGIVEDVAQRHKVSRLDLAVDLAGDAPKQVGVDGQASVLKDRIFDQPGETIGRFCTAVHGWEQKRGSCTFEDRARLLKIEVEQLCDMWRQQVIKVFVILDLCRGHMNVDLPCSATTDPPQMALKVQRGQVADAHGGVQQDLDRQGGLKLQGGQSRLGGLQVMRFLHQRLRQMQQLCEIGRVIQLQKPQAVLLAQPLHFATEPFDQGPEA